MKNTVKISSVVFGAEIENSFGQSVRLVNINLLEPLLQFKVNEDGEKELQKVRQFTIRMSEFQRLLVTNDVLALIAEHQPSGEELQLATRDLLTLQYADHLRLLKGAELTIKREEVYEDVLDEDGKPVLDEDGKPKQDLVGFGQTSFETLKLTAIAEKLAMKMLGF